jgi:UDP-glucose 4-epimerase
MKILVTGGMGYIGSHTCIELIKAGYEELWYQYKLRELPF